MERLKELPKGSRKIERFEGYFLSKDGRIFSNRKTGNGYRNFYDTYVELKGCVSKVGYKFLMVGFQYKQKHYYFHRLMWETFKGEIPEDKQINHLDGVKMNNHIDNLELTDASGNTWHAIRTGLLKHKRGSESNYHKLKEMDVTGMRAAWETGLYTKAELAKLYNITATTVRSIVFRKTWRHI